MWVARTKQATTADAIVLDGADDAPSVLIDAAREAAVLLASVFDSQVIVTVEGTDHVVHETEPRLNTEGVMVETDVKGNPTITVTVMATRGKQPAESG